MFLPSLGEMADEFKVGYETMAWAVSGYLAFTAAIQVLAGPLADRFGRKPVLLVCIIIFVLASVGCTFSSDFTTFLVFRIIQGSVMAGAVLAQAIVSDLFGKRESASLLGYIAMTMSLAPIIGPTIGGILGEFAGWRANFLVYSILGLLLLSLVTFQLPEIELQPGDSPSDFAGSYLELLGNRHFWAYTLIMAFGIGAFYIFVSCVPLVAGQQFSMNQFQIGLGMGSISCGFLVGSFLSGRLSTGLQTETIILFGRLIASLGLCGAGCLLLIGLVTPWTLFGGTIFVGIGNGLTTPGANASVMFVQKKLAASAAGFSGAVVVGFGAVLSGIAGYILESYPSALVLVIILVTSTMISLLIALWVFMKSRNTFDSI
ncbi:MAG: MFS transporter [Paracoccaceae bacterium]|nr:MFS transporter [Paracoccaceae bacterium]MDE2916889.1 MFS transporter [Paracoccaceae bacterium]